MHGHLAGSRRAQCAPTSTIFLFAPAFLSVLLWTAFAGAAPGRAEPLPEVPAPKVTIEEANHFAAMDAALEPARNYSPSVADAGRIQDAVKAISSANVQRFTVMRSSLDDPIGKKLLDWAKLRAGYGTAEEFREFLDNNPTWPDRTMLTQRMEEALFTQGGSAAQIKSAFGNREPDTGAGAAALASAYLAEGNQQKAGEYARRVWRELNIAATLENGFIKRFGSFLSIDDHKWRFDRLVTDDVRYASNRADRAAAAKRMIPRLQPEYQKIATARLALFNKTKQAQQLINALPPSSASDYGLIYHRIQVLRQDGKYEEGAKLILAQPTDPAIIAGLDEWWAERRGLAYLALKGGNPKLAYQLTENAGQLSENPQKEQSFLAGWISLRYLNNADAADRHFAKFAEFADGPLSRAKAAYWQGRAAEALGKDGAAKSHYTRATRDGDTFHGLLAMQKLEPGRRHLTAKPPAMPTPAQIAAFNNLDSVKAAVVARKSGLAPQYIRGFITSLRLAMKTEAEQGMVAHLAEALGDTQMAVRAGKASVAAGNNLIMYSYPVHPFPAYKPLRPPPEEAFLLGIARQETEFNTQIVSGAGAKGILQVMTITANHVCRDYKIKCEIPRLLSDPSYNAKIASAYTADRMEEFGGSYVLALAGYNAGPGRARQWIREFGDPRDAKVDPIDWIERIPIQETREYVAKVLSNIQIYRARLGEKDPLRLDQDLARARGSSKLPSDGTTVDDDPGTNSATDG